MRVSPDGLEFLIAEEGSIPYAYNDPVGFATFGVGHLIALRRVTAADGARWGTKDKPRRDLVRPTLRADLEEFEDGVRRAVRVSLNSNEFDALVSLALNIGMGAFRGSTVLRKLNAGGKPGAADAFLMWSMAGGKPILRARRERERELFLKPVKPKGPAAWLRPDELAWVREHDALLRQPRLTKVEHERVDMLRALMTARRKSIWRAAQKSGWHVNDRRARYDSLLSRSR